MSGVTWTNLFPANTYGDILNIGGDNLGLTSSLKQIQDGLGNQAPIYISTTNVNVTAFSFNGNAISLAGALTFSGSFATTITVTGTTSITLPTSGTLYGTATGSITSAQLATSVTDETGSGSLVFGTSPTLTTPTLNTPTLTSAILGTPQSGTLTNCTGLPLASGISGFGSGVTTWLATPSSANLAAAVTDETGSGALVFGTGPTITNASLVTPILGQPQSGNLTNCTLLPLSTGVTGTLATSQLATGTMFNLQQTQLTTPTTISADATWTDISGLSVTITPTSASDKVLVTATFSVAMSAGNAIGMFKLVRGSTDIGVGTSAGSRTPCGNAVYDTGGNGSEIYPMSLEWLDSPATTSATTYKVQAYSNSDNIQIGGTGTDTNNTQFPRTVSVITVIEVKV